MITLHCGLHKTGSSSVQVALRSGGPQGRRHHVPSPGMDHRDEAWRHRLARLQPRDVLSDENLLGSPFDGYGKSESRAALIRESLAGRDFQIVVYLRPQLAWLQSVYLQSVQQGSTLTPEEFLEGCMSSPALRWIHLLEILDETGAKRVEPRAFTEARNVVDDFMEFVGLGQPTKTQSGLRINASVTPAQAVILRELHLRFGSADHERLRSVFQHRLAAQRTEGKLSVFDEECQDGILQLFADDWQDVTARVGAENMAEHAWFETIGRRWIEQRATYVGGDLSAPIVQEAMLESLNFLASEPCMESRLHLRGLAGAFRRRFFA